MSTDWEWFFSSEWNRDRILRDRIDDLGALSDAAASRNARLSSRLASLQGSIETRLTALSAAFDAYVELGDVREQLTGFAENAAVRRDVQQALADLEAGRTPPPVDDRGTGYWLAAATDVVLGVAAGRPLDEQSLDRARATGPDADLFVVAALGSTGHGSVVSGRVPDLLVTDGELRAPQVAVFEGVLSGLYGDGVLAAVGERWASLLGGEHPGWHDWVAERSRSSDATDQLTWVRDQLTGPAPTDGGPSGSDDDARARLEAVVATLAAEGSGEERDLLRRARELRARIERPGDTASTRAADGRAGARADGREGGRAGGRRAVATEATRPVPMVVRGAYEAATDPALKAVLASWLRPALTAVVDDLSVPPPAAPATVEARTSWGVLTVTPQGADPAAVAALQDRLLAAYPSPTTRLLVPAVVAALALVVAVVVLAVGGPPSVVALLVVAAAVALVVLGRALYRQRGDRQEVADQKAQFDAAVAAATDRAAAVQANERATATARQRAVDEVRVALARS